MREFTPAHRLFDEVARRHADAVAVEAPDGDLTFAELDARSRDLATRLLRRGAGAETVVAVGCGRTTELIVAMLGVLRAGAAFLLLDTGEPAARTKEKLALADAAFMVGGDDGHGLPLIPVQAAASDPGVLPEVHPRQLAYVVFTSGTTGVPKGVLIEHLGLAEHVLTQLAPVYRRVGPDGTLSVGGGAPVTFDSFIDQVLPTLTLGHRLVLLGEMERRDPGSFLSRRTDVVDCSPSQLSLLVEFGLLDGPLRLAVFGGEKPGPEMWRALRAAAAQAVSVYGATECSIGSVEASPHDSDRVCLGEAAGSATLHLLGDDLRPADEGEIYLGGPGVGRGYLGDPRQTAERFVPDPFGEPGSRMYRTGDLGRRAPDGLLEFQGRADDQVKISGYRIEPGEVEAVLDTLPGVRRSAVVPAAVQGRVAHLVAYVETSPDYDEAAVRAELGARLPGYLVPKRVVPIAALPLTPNGKVDRNRLRGMQQ
ncbi:amino acid adenylation domain-containing protein [Herbidospora mongoliensis]|uniref:amino acid adenylation domain-containing protein n=1 Tax=Herbidospora mongoliensis TaxID=688067 RepID=UPI0008337E2F|nr:amino acid adenylation domain-containing protein [Herbidospora mongoliensis]